MGEVYSHLSEEERQVIQIEIGNGAGIRAIGAMIGRSPSTVSREIKRNTWFPSNESESYRPYRPRRLKTGPWMSRYYIAGPARRKAARRCAKARKPRRERRARCLPRGHRRRRKHAGRRVSRFPIPGRVSIAGRPPEADARSGFGHWEADSVIGMGCDLHTEVERRTRFLMARVIPDKTAERSVGARLAMFAPLPAAARLSVMHGNGTGFARHARLRDEPGMATCFADPYSSWQRGGNENRNGMIRRYLPKRTIIEPGMARELQEIVDETDNRPMRALGYRTPAEAFADELPDLQL